MSIVEETRTNGDGDGWVGRALKRKEDPPFIMGEGRYTDDISLTGMLHAAIIRSPEAHAKITSIDAGAALAHPDVVAVYTADDLDLGGPLPMAWVPPDTEMRTPEHLPLAKGKVCHVGDPVAVVVGRDRYTVTDAADDVIVEYEPLPVVIDPEKAIVDGSPVVHDAFGTNESFKWSLGGGDLEAGFAEADVIVERRIVNHRTSGAPIEPRSVIGDYRAGELTLYSTTQVPHILRLQLAGILGIPEDKLRVVAPDVGGGFGAKLQVYGEEALIGWLSRKVGRPVKWTETRSEHMQVSHHGRDQVDHVKMGLKRDGTITAWHVKILADLGAYHMLLTPLVPALGSFVMNGCYKIGAVQTDITGVFTNKFATDAIRGAGRPEATHMIEVTLDQAAAELGMDRLEIRRKNFIPPEEFPAETAVGIVYDSGNYPGALDKLLEKVDLDQFESEREEARSRGKLRGVGFSTYTEICGLAPSRAVGPGGVGIQAGFWESAQIRVHPSGTVTVYTGTSPHGQGLDTSMAQIVADRLGVTPDQVDIVHGDTGRGPMGMGTYGSRSLSVGGESVRLASEKVAEKAKQIAAHLLEAAPEDVELADGRWTVRGTDQGLALADVSLAAYVPENLPEGMEPGLEETNFYDPSNFVFPFGAHACFVEVDPETGKVEVVRYVAVDDCGPAINPKIIDGQVHGGIAHGIGQALYEQVVYDEEGQLVTGTFVDYALPTAAELPTFELDRTETPSPTNGLGVKGVGEAGTIACSPAVTNAVIDALRPLGVTFMNMPLTPMRVWQEIQAAQGDGGGASATEQGGSAALGGSTSVSPNQPTDGGSIH